MSDEAWVTLATNDTYGLGVLVLGQSLRRSGTTRQLHCLITPGISQGMREHLWSVFDTVSVVDVLDSSDEENLTLIQRPELGVTFTKLHCWRLTQYSKCVFLDADTLVLQNADELFDHEELSAAPDIGWPDIFNSGVFVFRPCVDTYRALLNHAITVGSFDGGDQGLLNTFFHDWRTKDSSFRLSFVYNMSSNVVYTYAAAYKKFGKDVKIVHFLGSVKPWQHFHSGMTLYYRPESQHLQSHVEYWWTVFREDVQALINPEYLPDSYVRVVGELYYENCEEDEDTPTLVSPVEEEQKKEEIGVVDEASDGRPHVTFNSLVWEHTTTLSGSSTSEQTPPEKKVIGEQRRSRRLFEQDHDELFERKSIPESIQFIPARHVLDVSKVMVEGSTEKKVHKLHERTLAEEPAIPSTVKHGYYDQVPPWVLEQVLAGKVGKVPPWVLKQLVAGVATEHVSKPVQTVKIKLPQTAVLSKTPSEQPRAVGRASLSGQGTIGGAGQFPMAPLDSDLAHQRAWEAGHVDYLGRDSWENIQKRLDKTLAEHE